MKQKTTTRTVYHIYVKIHGVWFDKEFAAKDCGHEIDYGAITLAVARALVGKTGNVWKITTTAKEVVQNKTN